MKYSLLLMLLAALSCSAQTTTTGKADTKGACSPAVTGNDNKFTITCPGIGKEQGQKMLSILNKILANQLDPEQVMAKLDEISKAVSRPAQNAPGGISIGRDNNGTATVNNFAPGPRHLSQRQIAAIQEVVASSSEVTYRIVTTSDAISQNYANEIYGAISPIAKQRLVQGPIVGLGAWRPRAPENANVCATQTGTAHDLALKIVSILKSDGTTTVNFYYDCDQVPASEIFIAIGPPT